MTVLRIAIAGDRFMLSDVFREEIERALPVPATVRTLELAWPDEPMHHGYVNGVEAPVTAGLREFFGDPDAIVAFIDDAEIFVTHLAPVSTPMLERVPNLKLDRRLPRRSGQHRRAGGLKAAGMRVVNTPGAQRQRRRRVHDRRHPRRDAPHPRRPRGPAPRRVAGRPLPRRHHRLGTLRAHRRHRRLRRTSARGWCGC